MNQPTKSFFPQDGSRPRLRHPVRTFGGKVMKPFQLILALLVYVSPWGLPAFGQYYGERVMEKSFEQTDFFFTPSFLNPFGIRGFTTALSGLVNDPLLNLQTNPAALYSDSGKGTFMYLDFRSTRNIIDRAQYGYPYWGGRGPYLDVVGIPYSLFYVTTRKELDPVFSAAVLTRPLKDFLPQLFVGVTYQMVFQNDRYYSIPQDIYRSAFGYDYTGARLSQDSDIPIIDKYSGKDDMQQRGDFSSFYAGYDINDQLQIGGRLSRVTFTRDGSFGSKNFNEYAYTTRSTSTWVWHNMESRTQEYTHWDLGAGMNYGNRKTILLGVSAGYIVGAADQILGRLDSSLYAYGQPNTSNDWNYSRRLASTNQKWDHNGNTFYGGLNLLYRLNEEQTLTLSYGTRKQDIDIRLGSTIVDSSSYSYRYQWSGGSSSGDYRYNLTDNRTGMGTRRGTFHRVLAGLQWRIESNLDLNIGFVYQTQESETKTSEAISANYQSLGTYTWSGTPTNYTYGGSERKRLMWEFKTDFTMIQIPLLFTWKAGERFQLLFGLNRQISDWRIEDVTLALFDYRHRWDGSGSTRKDNFGERYTLPPEKTSDIRTTVIAGITVSPSPLFNVRLLLTPTQLDLPDGSSKSDFQWWIGILFYP
jgi:hypothetical protein